MLSYQLFAENVLFLPLHWRNKGAIWSWLKLLTDNKNIFTSSPPIVPSCGFSQSLYPPLIAKTIKTKQHKFVSSTLKIFKSQHIKDIFGSRSASEFLARLFICWREEAAAKQEPLFLLYLQKLLLRSRPVAHFTSYGFFTSDAKICCILFYFLHLPFIESI